jgi:hypothetical protein
MSIKENYYIKKIDYQTATKMIVEFHYLHRKAPCRYSFGLFDKSNDELMGCIMYGVPASRALQKGICGTDEADNVIELTRLWIDDRVGKNAESFLIGNTIPLIKEDILVSYAEDQQGHVGYVYQATNWIYTGLSDRHVEWSVKGENPSHSRHLFDKYGGVNKAKEILGDKIIKKERPRKHRYIYFNCNKRRKKELIKKLRYTIQVYPKLHND